MNTKREIKVRSQFEMLAIDNIIAFSFPESDT